MAKLDLNSIKLKLSTSKEVTEKLRAQLDPIANKIVDNAKKELIDSFIEHPVSEEIEEGADATNISDTLDGKGNLWGFIGFHEGSGPIKDVVDILETNIEIQNRVQGRDAQGRFLNGGDQLLFDYKINIPSKEDLAKDTPLPWETSKSWLFGIEKGISGFSSYIYWKRAGRSTAGVQANNGREKNGQFNGEGAPIQLRPGRFKNTSYFSPMYNKFLSNFKTTVRL